MCSSINFHERALVAPLKRRERSGDGAAMPVFPRARARGPIEARQFTVELTKALKFPRARARGPIEARYCLELHAGWSHFHERALVAPLKRAINRRPESVSVTFPRARARGPIEALP